MAGGPSRSPALIRKPFWRSLLVRRWSGHTRGFDKTVPDLAGVLRGCPWPHIVAGRQAPALGGSDDELPFGTPEGAKMVGSTACGAVSNMEGASEKVPIPGL
ncbi:hypothetical protein WJX84_005699 [Apatococcus fuscideae]|uniref:Uncharacterized protein n=1 Tax=Apatococcus fuscideae TaxID=2026836 RepID=A0AAW1TBT2_9CHLO